MVADHRESVLVGDAVAGGHALVGELGARRVVAVDAAEQLHRLVQVVAQAADADDHLGQRRERQAVRQPDPLLALPGRQVGQLAGEVRLAQPGVRRLDPEDAVEAARPRDDAAVELLRVVGAGQVDRLIDLVVTVQPLQQVAVAVVGDDGVDVRGQPMPF